MKYAEAFGVLGYRLPSPRQDWSAVNDTGVCLSLWRTELSNRNGLLWFDTSIHGRPIAEWGFKPGNRLRIQHLETAIRTFDGFVDVILVSGLPGVGYENASPWKRAQRKSRWRVVSLDTATGHFEIILVPD